MLKKSGSPTFGVGSLAARHGCKFQINAFGAHQSECAMCRVQRPNSLSANAAVLLNVVTDPWLTVCRRAVRPSRTSPLGRAKCASLTAARPDDFRSAKRFRPQDDHPPFPTHPLDSSRSPETSRFGWHRMNHTDSARGKRNLNRQDGFSRSLSR